MFKAILFYGVAIIVTGGMNLAAEPPTAAVRPDRGYSQTIELKRGTARAVLCPEAGGRVLEFSSDGVDAMYFDEQERDPPPGKPRPMSAGRFDYGPELTVAAHPQIWSGTWAGQVTGPSSARLTSMREEAAGMQVIREFELVGDKPAHLVCRQTLLNISGEVREVCHWGRSFSPGGGICLVPLGDRPSRFPSRYAMYEDGAIINVRNTDPNIRERDGFLEILAPPRKPKLGLDSYAGWLGYLMPNDWLFVKRFPAYPDRVYNEAAGLTLSVWYPEGPRIELEPIGPRERLKPGERATFVEEWWLLPYQFPTGGKSIDLQKLRSIVETQTTPPNVPGDAATSGTD